MAFELLDHRSELARQFGGTFETIIKRDPDGRVIPILNFYHGEGQRMDAQTANRLAQNIVDVLNDRQPADMTAQGMRAKWQRLAQGFNILFQQGTDLSKKTGVLALFNKACPFDDIAEVSDRLAERNGLAGVLRKVTMTQPSAPLAFNPSPHHQR